MPDDEACTTRLHPCPRLLFCLLALPIGAGKGVDGIVTGDVDWLGLGVHPLPYPVALCKAGLKACLTPRAGDIVFIPQTDLPCTAHARIGHGGGIGVHGTALYFAALPYGFVVGGYFNFICRLAHAVSALPRQNSGPASIPTGAVRWLVLRFIARIVKGLLYIVLPIL